MNSAQRLASERVVCSGVVDVPWKSMSPWVVSALKLGAVLPRRRGSARSAIAAMVGELRVKQRKHAGWRGKLGACGRVHCVPEVGTLEIVAWWESSIVSGTGVSESEWLGEEQRQRGGVVWHSCMKTATIPSSAFS